MLSKVAILAGGMGTRLRSRTGDLPKPMAPIMGKPVLQHQLELCRVHGFVDIAILVHYQSNAISEYFGDGSAFGVNLRYVVETTARGTAGALSDALEFMDDRFLVLYGDTYADVNLSNLWKQASANDADATLLLHPNDHPQDSDLVEVDEQGNIVAIRAYPHPEGCDYPNLVNAALYVINKNSISGLIPENGKYDLAKDTFGTMLAAGRRLQAYITPEYIKDMGTPGRLDKVEKDLIDGLPERLSGRSLRKAVFLDRDGTLNREVNHLNHPSQVELLPGVAEAVHALNRAGVLAVGITNQPVLARGELSKDGLRDVHARLETLLGEGHAYLDRMYVCPHHPDAGFPGEISELKCDCVCRKPKPGLIDQAIAELDISRASSWMVGDTTGDILAGQRAGVKTVLLRSGYAGRDYKYDADPDYVSDSLADAVQWILHGHAATTMAVMPAAHAFRSERMILIGGAARVGKTSAAQVMVELLRSMGRTAHVISLDAWLKLAAEREEGAGVLSRYDMPRCIAELSALRDENVRVQFPLDVWDRKTSTRRASKSISVGPDDVIVVEGVPALLSDELKALTNASIHVNTSSTLRFTRLRNEYFWRGESSADIERKIQSRELDEVAAVNAAGIHARYQLEM